MHTSFSLNLLAVLRLGYRVGAALAVVFGYIFTLPEGGAPVLEHVADAESVTIEPALLAQLWTI